MASKSWGRGGSSIGAMACRPSSSPRVTRNGPAVAATVPWGALVLDRPFPMPVREKREDGPMAWLKDRIGGQGRAEDGRSATPSWWQRLRAGDEAAFAELDRPLRRRRCCGSRGSTSATAPSPRRSCRRPGWRCSTGIDRFEGRSQPQDLDLPHPHQPGQDPRRAGGPHASPSRRSPPPTPRPRRADAWTPTASRAPTTRAVAVPLVGPAPRLDPRRRLLARETLGRRHGRRSRSCPTPSAR